MIHDDVRSVRRGHAPNCSATGPVVGAALLTVAATGLLVNTWADRVARWLDGEDPAPPEPPRARRERRGAVLSWPAPAALLRVSDALFARAVARGAVPIGGGDAPAGALSAPLEVHVSLGTRCPARCSTCHTGASPDGDPGPDDVPAVLAALARAGVFEVAFGGGEPLSRPDLVALGREARRLGLVPNLTTSGLGLTPDLARELAGVFGQVNVSLDGLGGTYRAVRGFDGTRAALAAIRLLADAGVPVGVNTVITRDNADDLLPIGRAARDAGAREWQWLRLKPAGRAASDYPARAPAADQLLRLWPAALAAEAELGMVIRWDCAMVPFLAAHGVPPAALSAAAVRGCPGGRSLLTRHADGAWAPCSFAAGGDRGDAGSAWAADAQLRAWRARPTPEPCRACDWREVCGSGCRVVAAHLTGDPFAADPECPRVRAAGAA
jgi:radical SAM protein with 4Fe4S-binding SPASM domain